MSNPPIDVSKDLSLGVAGYAKQRYIRGEVVTPFSANNFNSVVRVVADALTATGKLLEFTVVKLNEDMEIDVYTLTDYENGIKPFGLTAGPVEEGVTGASIPVATNGRFLLEGVHFHESFITDEDKVNAFTYNGSNIQIVEQLYFGIE